jgi:peptide/nickel transport system ATP-binding protein/oligopeptide transport system ATP-binding protein
MSSATTQERPVSASRREVLRVDDLAMHFSARRGSTAVKAVDGVDLVVHQYETLGLVGESGCGKTTLVRTILGLNAPTRGSVVLGGLRLDTLGNRSLRSARPRMQVVFQDPYTSLDPRMSVHDTVAEPLRINRKYSAARVAELLDQVGLPADAARRKPREFSGGQRQRIGIARALALNPELLILDEPVSALDVSVQAQVINLLGDLQRELGLAYLFIAHDLSVVRHVSHRVAVMYLGRIVETGTREQVFDDPQHPYTKSLLSAVPVPDPRRRDDRQIVLSGDLPNPANPPSGCAFRTRCPVAQPDCALTRPDLDPAAVHSAACHYAGTDLVTRL